MSVKAIGKLVANEAWPYAHANAALKRQKMCLSFNQALKYRYVGKNPHVCAWGNIIFPKIEGAVLILTGR